MGMPAISRSGCTRPAAAVPEPAKLGGCVDECQQCHGSWFDFGELEILREKGIFDTVAGFFKRVIG
jgi:Zn-finger nucleic acid-binding protein